jgi:hypothetical protein
MQPLGNKIVSHPSFMTKFSNPLPPFSGQKKDMNPEDEASRSIHNTDKMTSHSRRKQISSRQQQQKHFAFKFGQLCYF